MKEELTVTNGDLMFKATTLVVGTRDVGCTCYYPKHNSRWFERMASPAGH